MPALSPRTGESLASVALEGLDDTANSSETSQKQTKIKKYGFGKRFAYQKLKGWRPTFRAHNAEIFFLAVGTLMLALGIPILVASLNVREYSVRYDDAGPFATLNSTQQQGALWAASDAGIVYSVNLKVDANMEPPIYVIFELGSFHQNYRRYVRSYDSKQMHNNGSNIPGADACNPYKYQADNPNSSLPYDGAVVPCGQISHSFFNDSFSLAVGNSEVAVDDSAIAWSTDANHLYGDVTPVNYNLEPVYRGGNTTTLPLNKAQHWMVWQRPGGQSPVQKLYGTIQQKIPKGTIVNVTVANRYNTYAFGGSKILILTTNSWVGGRNTVLPIAYLVVAGLCYLAALAFFLGYDLGLVWKRRPGVVDDFSWVRHSGTNGE